MATDEVERVGIDAIPIVQYCFGEIRTKEFILELGVAPEAELNGADKGGMRPDLFEQRNRALGFDYDIAPEGWEECPVPSMRHSAAWSESMAVQEK